jgi:hypothetical protein
MILRGKNRTALSLLIVSLLVLQSNALPLHESLLRWQGYTLVQVSPADWNAETPVKSLNGNDYYNISVCSFHYRIHVLSNYDEPEELSLLALGLFVLLVAGISRQRVTVLKNYFLTSISLRAPPSNRTIPTA